jgi:lysophospholipase L1-like esterase
VDECNVWVEELANELGLHFVNVSGVLKNDEGYLREDFSADGIHLTDEAYRLVYEELKPYLLEAAGLA